MLLVEPKYATSINTIWGKKEKFSHMHYCCNQEKIQDTFSRESYFSESYFFMDIQIMQVTMT